MSIVFDELAEFDRQVFHNIQGIKLGFDEFDDLTDNPKARAYAHRASSFSEVQSNLNELQYQAIDFLFEKNFWLSSRFSDGSYPVWYGSLDLETSFHETIYHWKRYYLDAPKGFNQMEDQTIATLRTVFKVQCRAALIDLRNKTRQNPELIDPEPSHYSQTQKLGQRLHREGYPGLITHSARLRQGENIAVFRKEILSAPLHDNDYRYEYDLGAHKVVIKQLSSEKIVFSI